MHKPLHQADTTGSLAARFIGPNSAYYREQWRSRDKQSRPGLHINRAALASFGLWFFYRKMLAQGFGLALIWGGLLFLAFALDYRPVLMSALGIGLCLPIVATIADGLYRRHVGKRIAKIGAASPNSMDALIARQGGVSRISAALGLVVYTSIAYLAIVGGLRFQLQYSDLAGLLGELASLKSESQKNSEQSVASEDAEDLLKLALMYYKGDVLQQSYTTAFQLFEKAAILGNPLAQTNLAGMYLSGRGVERNPQEAFAWFMKAAEQGMPGAQYNIAVLYNVGSGVTQDYAEAAKWYSRAADQELADAQYGLGILYENGWGVDKDYKQAFDLYQKAARQGYASAQFNLGSLYDRGLGVQENVDEALVWYAKAAEQGDTYALFNLGALFINGHGVLADPIEAYKWFTVAATLGDKDAMKQLESLISTMPQKDVERGIDLARQWMQMHPHE